MVSFNSQGSRDNRRPIWPGFSLSSLWRRESRTPAEPATMNENAATVPPSPAQALSPVAKIKAEESRFIDNFGPAATDIMMATLFGENSPLAGQFRPTAHPPLMRLMVAAALGNAKFDAHALNPFFEILEQQKRAGEADPDPGKVNFAVLSALKDRLIFNLYVGKNFHETFETSAEQKLKDILFGPDSPLAGQFRPSAKPYLTLHAMHALMYHKGGTGKFLDQFLEAIERQKRADSEKPLEKRIKADPEKLNRQVITALIAKAQRTILPKPPGGPTILEDTHIPLI